MWVILWQEYEDTSISYVRKIQETKYKEFNRFYKSVSIINVKKSVGN